ncbi:MAG: M3 family oligoendopeptidase [Tumebacillaceae bacterium]
MKFSEFAYERPDFDQLKANFHTTLERFQNAASFAEQDEAMAEINKLRIQFESAAGIVNIRHTINTADEFYEAEKQFMDDVYPLYQGIVSEYYDALLSSNFRTELEAKWGAQLFQLAELARKTFKPEIVEDLQQENKLRSEYVKLMSSAKIPFEGKVLTLSQFGPYMQSTDREMREKASAARSAYYAEHEAEFDAVYDGLVKIRTQIAKKLGFDNFVEVGYARMQRVDYNASMVAKFREQVLTEIVPVVGKLKEKQRARIGVDTLRYFDDRFYFKTGNAKPKGDPDWIVAQGKQMYSELSPVTGDFFNYLIENELTDLVSKEGKMVGGYCSFIAEHNVPFIFSNFSGTSGDVDVLTHEAGHALQVYSSRHHQVPEYHWPTSEGAEIHSMSMEFFTWPWMNLFFKEDTEKYKFSHLSFSLEMVPYIVVVDEFQHLVYENPEATPAERKQFWRDLEKKYLPHKNYEGNDYLERGGWWHQQLHIFEEPFYYIDYGLAQICAFQFWKRDQEDHASAWQDYLNICKTGGSKPFLDIVAEANLLSPFADGCVKSVIGQIEAYLDSVDDKAL